MADGTAKSLGEKLLEALVIARAETTTWFALSDAERTICEQAGVAFAASISHDETANAVITDLRERLQATEVRAQKVEAALKNAAAYVDEAGGICLALAMSGKDHPRLDELLMGLQAKSQAIAPTLRAVLKTEGA
ncbi:hypothetical protein J2X45_003361 [Caulobacter sp. BE264]|uniref:hypothetical protein n=1 Tax=Caulobacter sp. BE264 TaxID=2817724 RepID=UPI00285751D7|nr:hypothetical protein [Caulobacter sp. BE264]MDR7232255.1 hypothetical protein [Caulobacter sp. BE264]